jgi:DNA helicase-2/ATP-dependent DNA helicase PcrA
MAWDDGLEGPGRAFAASQASRIRCLAGPGTGKTYSLMRRVQRLIEEERVDPSRILVVTLTRTAADDLRKNLEELQVPGAQRVATSTLHSFCLSTLLHERVLRVTGRVPRLLATFERDILLKDLPDSLGTFTEKKRLLTQFEAAWSSLDGSPLGNAPQTYFAENPYSVALEQFDHILVDEYQDLNRADHGVIECLAEAAIRRRGHLAVIGDDDQCIYVILRHAHPRGIVNFQAEDNIPIVECRRCPKRITSMAQNLIEHNPGRAKPPLLPRASNLAGTIHNVIAPTMQDEAEKLSQFVHDRIESGAVSPGEVLILANWRAIAYSIRDRLVELGHDAHSYFSEEALDTTAAQRILTLLTLLANPADRVALRSFLALGSATENRAAYRRIKRYVEENGMTVEEVLTELADGRLRIPYTGPAVATWQELVEELERLKGLRDDVGAIVEQLCPTHDEETKRLREAMERTLQTPKCQNNLREFVSSLRTHIGVPEVPLDAVFIRLMSLHKSKGLTVKLVVIAGLVEGLVPRTLGEDLTHLERQEHEQEQRRILYVGITRPTEELVLSRFQSIDTRSARVSGAATGRWIGRGVQATLSSSLLRELGTEFPQVTRSEDWEY